MTSCSGGAAPVLEVGELRLGGVELLLGLALRGRFLLGLEREQRRVRLDASAALHREPLEPAGDRRRDVDELALDVALVSGRRRSAARGKRSRDEYETGRAPEGGSGHEGGGRG